MSQAVTQRAHDRPPTVVVVTIPVGVGGSTRSVVNLLTYIDGLADRVVVGPAAGRVVDLIAERGAADTYLPYVPGAVRFRRLRRVLTAARIAWWVARHRRSVHAIHANGLAELNLALPAAFLLRVPLVVWVHQYALPPSVARTGRWWRLVLPRTPVRWATVSPFAADLVVDAGLAARSDVTVVPNPIDPADVLAPARPAEAAVRVAYLGTPAHYKGLHLLPDLIEAVDRRLAPPNGEGAEARWLIFSRQNGDDMAETWDRLRAMTRTHPVSLEGKSPDVAGIYARCDIVVCPSLQESFCRVAAEAMLNGIPVVGSDLEPVRALLGDDEAGLLFDVGDVDAAADAVVRLVREPALRERLGAAGRARVEAFGPDRVRAQFVDLFELAEAAT